MYCKRFVDDFQSRSSGCVDCNNKTIAAAAAAAVIVTLSKAFQNKSYVNITPQFQFRCEKKPDLD